VKTWVLCLGRVLLNPEVEVASWSCCCGLNAAVVSRRENLWFSVVNKARTMSKLFIIQSLLNLIHTSFGSFSLDIQNHIVEYPCRYEVAWSDVLIIYFWLNGVNFFRRKKFYVLNLTQMKSLLMVKMCNKANIFNWEPVGLFSKSVRSCKLTVRF
jgi:hypothetical protein